jgi:hypothetical protein
MDETHLNAWTMSPWSPHLHLQSGFLTLSAGARWGTPEPHGLLTVGARVGDGVGADVGNDVGEAEGAAVGLAVGEWVGGEVGLDVGAARARAHVVEFRAWDQR